MSRVSSTSASAVSLAISNPSITNTTVTASTEYTVSIPTDAKRFRIQLRGFGVLEIRTAAAAAAYWTIPVGNYYEEKEVSRTDAVDLFITPTRSGVLEVIYWT